EDTPSGKFPRSAESTGPIAAGLLPRAHEVARQIDPAAHLYATKSEAAMAAYITGLERADPDALSRAIAADADFAAPYLALIELSLARHDRAAAERTLAMARVRGAAIPPVDRARLEVTAAQLSGDPTALAQSLVSLARLNPADTNLLRSLGDNELAARRYSA